MADLMIDLETMSSNMDAPIMSIGAVVFDPTSTLVLPPDLDMNGLPLEMFYVNVDLQSCLDRGLKVSGDTIYWWLKQNDAARNALSYPTPVYIEIALTLLKDWIRLNNVQHVWAHANFDLAILHTAYIKCGHDKVPWKYTLARDVRTIYDIAFHDKFVPDVPNVGKHNALYDAIRQAIGVQLCYKELAK